MKAAQNTCEYWKTELIKEIRSLGTRYDTWNVFNDLITMITFAISNAVTRIRFDELEKQYIDIMKSYDKPDQPRFKVMHEYIINALDCSLPEYRDVLGEVCQELSLTNKNLAQDFTPHCMALLMAEIVSGDSLKAIEENGFTTLSEPTCGGGVTILAYAEMLAKKKYNPSEHMCVTAVDISFKCVCMTYIQLSYYGIPAVVIHGDTLLVKEYSRWYTPLYIAGNWIWKCKCGLTDGYKAEDEMIKLASEPIYAALRKMECL